MWFDHGAKMNSESLNNLFERKKLPEINNDDSILYQYYTYQCKELREYNIQTIKLEEFLEIIKKSENLELLINNINSIKKEFIFNSKKHGYTHIERVTLFSYFLAINNNLTTRDTQLLLYAAMYHDIGRIDDSMDQYHGLRSANKLDQLELNVTPEELNILKTIITCHSIPDEWFEEVAQENNILDFDRTRKLFNILKDADGLDRVRLGCPHVALDFLRCETSKKMIPLAYQLINFYNNK